MKDIPGCIRERRYSVTHLLPTPEAWAASLVRSSEVAAKLVRDGYRVVGKGKNWRIVLDTEMAKHPRPRDEE